MEMPFNDTEDEINNLEGELIDIYYDFDLPTERKEKLIRDLDDRIRNLKILAHS